MAAKTIIRSNQYLEAPISDPKHLVNKQYVDDLIERNIKQPVRLGTTKNLAGVYTVSDQRFTGDVAGILEIDDIEVNNGDRLLLKDQTDATQNGIYIVINRGSALLRFVLERSKDFNASEKIPKNTFIRVSEGETQSDILFQLVNDEQIVLDTTPMIFVPYRSGGSSDVNKAVIYATGDGITTDFMITHNLNTEDVDIRVRHNNDTILVNWEVVSINVVKITFDTPLENNLELKIIIFG